LWTDEAPQSARVVAMIGPAEVRAGSTALTRTIETIESAGQIPAIHRRVDTAVMHLELLPQYPAGATPADTGALAGRSSEPAAVYALTRAIMVASYEACAGMSPSAVRYLRRDGRGGIARDAMLHRVSTLK
jgi:hypothetical protein